MYSIRMLPEFLNWLNNLADSTAKGFLIARIKRLEAGLLGDTSFVGDGIFELRIHTGPGWRIYYTHRDKNIIVLLAGGSKHSQKKDIKRAKTLAGALH